MKTITAIVTEVLYSLLKEIFIKNDKIAILRRCSDRPTFLAAMSFCVPSSIFISMNSCKALNSLLWNICMKRVFRGHISVKMFLWRSLKGCWQPKSSSTRNVNIFKINSTTDFSAQKTSLNIKLIIWVSEVQNLIIYNTFAYKNLTRKHLFIALSLEGIFSNIFTMIISVIKKLA